MQTLSQPGEASVKTSKSSPQTATLNVKGMKCAGCVSAVERQLLQNSGVVRAQVNLITEVAVVEYDAEEIQPETLAQKLTSRGFPSQLRQENKLPGEAKDEPKDEQKSRLIIAAVLLAFSTLGHLGHWGGFTIPVLSNIWFHAGLATLALLFPGREILVDGWRGLRYGAPNMNTLVGLGTSSAYLASLVALLFPQLGWDCFFDEPVMLLGFILLGRTLEGRARQRASSSLRALLALQPPVARLVGAGNEQEGIEIPVEQVQPGEWIRVLPGEKIPVDGEIVGGETTVNEAMLTGEAIPVAKTVGDQVQAGTLNQSGVISIKAQHTGKDTTLAQIIRWVEDAQTRKAPIQQLADTVAGYFAYGVMAIASVVFLFWYFLGTRIWSDLSPTMIMDQGMEMTMNPDPLLLSLKLAIAVLVVACPCALGLATPTAILVGTSIGAEQGLLIKGGDILERVHQLDTIVFDKTGTLTQGQPTVTDCWAVRGDEKELLQLAATVASGTTHPLAAAIGREAQRRELELLTAKEFQTVSGLGASAQIEGQPTLIGSRTWLQEQNINLSPEIDAKTQGFTQAGKTLVYVAQGGEVVGAIALQDTLRPDASKTVKQLQDMGLEVVLLSGDQAEVANAIAHQLHISQVYAPVRPEEKAATIQALQREKVVAMIGDGINDAPALAQADISISLQTGTDVAIETAGIVLMGQDLQDVVKAIHLSLATFRKIRQNLFWALGYNIIAIPIAAGVLLPPFGILLSPALAGAFMAVSSILVVTNSLLLRRQFSTGN
jgi:Cu2+-exporting ATPase